MLKTYLLQIKTAKANVVTDTYPNCIYEKESHVLDLLNKVM